MRDKILDEYKEIQKQRDSSEICDSVAAHRYERLLQKLEAEIEKDGELKLYKQALTKAVSLPAGAMPNGQNYNTIMLNGNVFVTKPWRESHNERRD